MRIALIEDSEQEMEHLNSLVQEYFSQRQIFRIVDTFSDGNSFLDKWQTGTYDLVFLDILMPGITGIDVARRIRETDPECLIIFISASTEFALQGFEVRAFDYLVKPLTFEKLEHTMELCHDQLVKRIHYIELKIGRNIVKLPLQEIIYTDYYNHYIQVHTPNGMLRSYRQFDTFAPLLLSYPQFLCCYRNCIVNMDLIDSLDNEDFIMTSGEHIPIMKGTRRSVRQQYADYQFRKINGGV